MVLIILSINQPTYSMSHNANSPVSTISTSLTPVSATSYPGYLLLSSNGNITSYGGVPLFGSPLNISSAPVSALVRDNSTGGYWAIASNGAVFSFNAPYYGSAVRMIGNATIVGAAATPNGAGYWLVTSNGAVFNFGNADFYGSLAKNALSAAIVAVASTPDGEGYWLVDGNGGVFSFGDAKFYGSLPSLGITPTHPITGAASTPDGEGYWLLGADGGVFSFGDAKFYGSNGNLALGESFTSITSSPDGGGYWMVSSTGAVFNFGDAYFRGEPSTGTMGASVVAIAEGPGNNSPPPGIDYPQGAQGYDISWPQCGEPYPPAPYVIAIVGINGGSAFTYNQCLASQAAWAGPAREVYININSPITTSHDMTGPSGNCSATDYNCQAFNYGYNDAQAAINHTTNLGISANVWWLDVETAGACTNSFPTAGSGYWSCNTALNALTIQGALDALKSNGFTPGIYSTYLQYPEIAGSYAPGGPLWVPGAQPSQVSAYCTQQPWDSFAGGTARIIQEAPGTYDPDYAC
ncbi:MAG: hypothetical protein M1483_03545 [Actinobacteria bacterium]|nr:hypothetical protein [Actinomycetota bacterium]